MADILAEAASKQAEKDEAAAGARQEALEKQQSEEIGAGKIAALLDKQRKEDQQSAAQIADRTRTGYDPSSRSTRIPSPTSSEDAMDVDSAGTGRPDRAASASQSGDELEKDEDQEVSTP